MLNFSRVSAGQPSVAYAMHRMPHSGCKLLVLLQTSDKQTTVEPRADADQPPPIPRLSPLASVSTHLARFVGTRDMYMRNYTVDFPNGSRRRKKELFSCSTALLATSSIVWRALAWPGHCGGSFLFDFLIVYFSSRPAAVLHLWPTQQEVYGLDSHWE